MNDAKSTRFGDWMVGTIIVGSLLLPFAWLMGMLAFSEWAKHRENMERIRLESQQPVPEVERQPDAPTAEHGNQN